MCHSPKVDDGVDIFFKLSWKPIFGQFFFVAIGANIRTPPKVKGFPVCGEFFLDIRYFLNLIKLKS